MEGTPSSAKTVKILEKDKYFYIHSKYDPLFEANVYVDNLDINPDDIIILIGNGLGYATNEILKKLTEFNSFFIFETNRQVFNTFRANFNSNALINSEEESIKYTLMEDPSKFTEYLNDSFSFTVFDKLKFVILPSYMDIWPSEMKIYKSAFEEFCDKSSGKLKTLQIKSDAWQINPFKNFSYIVESYTSAKFFDKFKDKPIVIVSAGPSLDKNVRLLKGLEDKVVIISVYTALRALYKQGIKPHFVVAVEENQLFYGDCYKDIPLFFSPVINNLFMNNYKGKKILMQTNMSSGTNTIFENYLNEEDFIEVGGSVACEAVDIALKLGGNPVILIGQDLSFTSEMSHAKNTYEDLPAEQLVPFSVFSKKDLTGKDFFVGKDYSVKDIYGNEAFTSHAFLHYSDWFERFFEKNKDKTTFINATEGGILKNHVQIMNLSEVIDKFCTENIGVTDIINSVFENGRLVKDNEKGDLIEHILKIKNELESLLESLQEPLRLNEILKDMYAGDKPVDQEEYKNLSTQIDNMDVSFRTLVNGMKITGPRLPQLHFKVNYKIDKNDRRETVIAKNNIIFYKGVIEIINEILPLLETAIQDVKLLMIHEGKN